MASSSPETDSSTHAASQIKRQLGLWDTVGIIVGIVVGTSIFVTPPLVLQNVAGPWQGLGVWLLGGVLSLMGAFCYAELATSYPRSGGDYEYLSRAYGPWLGFVFGWAQLCIVLTGSIGAMAYAFANYGVKLWGLEDTSKVWLAAGAVLGLSIVNLLGVMVSKSAQSVLTGLKVLGLVVIVAAGLLCAASSEPRAAMQPSAGGGWALALVFVLYAYGGWNDAAFISAEVRDVRRNIPRSLFLSLGIVTAIYLAINATFISVLGFEGARHSATPAADVLQQVAGSWAADLTTLLVMVSALSAINGLILTGSRILHSLGDDHRLFRHMAGWHGKLGVPTGAILAQALVSLALVVVVGTPRGQQAIDATLQQCGLSSLPWKQFDGGFEILVAASAPVFWAFFLLTGLALFVLRVRDKHRPRSFSTPWYPLPPILFCLTCLFMLHASLDYARGLSLVALIPVALGVPLYLLSRRFTANPNRMQPVVSPAAHSTGILPVDPLALSSK
jgi:amino acid transporter